MIERGIVRIEEGGATVHPVPRSAEAKPQSLSLEDFWAAIGERDSAWPAAVRQFLTALAPPGIYHDLPTTLSLKPDLPDKSRPINFGYSMRNAQFWPRPFSKIMPEAVWSPYFETPPAMVGGHAVKNTGGK